MCDPKTVVLSLGNVPRKTFLIWAMSFKKKRNFKILLLITELYILPVLLGHLKIDDITRVKPANLTDNIGISEKYLKYV